MLKCECDYDAYTPPASLSSSRIDNVRVNVNASLAIGLASISGIIHFTGSLLFIALALYVAQGQLANVITSLRFVLECCAALTFATAFLCSAVLAIGRRARPRRFLVVTLLALMVCIADRVAWSPDALIHSGERHEAIYFLSWWW